MVAEIKIPALGESISEGVVSRWLKQDGEQVAEGDIVLELETDKVNAEIPTEASGVLRHGAKEGDTVAVGAVVGTIDPDAKPSASPEASGKKPGDSPKAEPPRFESASDPEEELQAIPERAEDSPPASSLARRVAEGMGRDLGGIKGSGAGGKIMKRDVLEAGSPSSEPKAEAKPAPAKQEAPSPPAQPAAPSSSGPRERRERMSGLRKRIAQRLVESQRSTATLTTFNEVDMTELLAMRARYKDAFKEQGSNLGFMSFFAKAAVDALKAFPAVNARVEGDEIVYNERWDLGVAVSTERGLVVPVIRDVDTLSFAQIESAVYDFAKRARDNKLKVDELQGGTFTISNGGVFGSLMSTPILNPPQSGILGMHAVQDRPVAIDGQIVIRPMMYVALSYDHRVIDGRESVSFLKRIKECVEHPERMMLNI